LAECEVCGRAYDELTFQLVLREAARAFDSVECAMRAREGLPGADEIERGGNAQGVLEQLELAAAELFATRAQLGAERRRRRQLEQQAAAQRLGAAEGQG
jgi:hypothetical protein